jgi:multiple sugar transport system substrate-binding protein
MRGGLSMVQLRGSSWNHERGHAPLVATAAEYERMSGGAVQVSWEPRSLKEFGISPVDELARRYDLVVIDHPHIGLIAGTGCAVPIDDIAKPANLDALAAHSPGRSHQSYQYAGHQWALAVDAACQVSAWRPDLLPAPPRTWGEVLDLSRSGRVLWPLCDVDSAASMLTLLASAGSPVTFADGHVIDRGAAERALEIMREAARASDPRCLSMNPIDVLEVLSGCDDFWYAPLIFGYLNYSRPGHHGKRVAFGDIPRFGEDAEPAGSLLGGVGLVVSAYSPHRDAALGYALYVAAGSTQRTTYLAAGGQPAHHDVWSDRAADESAGGFFSATSRALEASWTRPRTPGFVRFQNEMIELFGDHRRWLAEPGPFLDELDVVYRRRLPSGAAGTSDWLAEP